MTEYEQAFANWLGVDHAYGFWKGRVALYAILRGLGIGDGDEIVLPGYTCAMAVNPIIYLGAKPIFVDIEPETYNIDPNQIESKITPRTKLIIAQHTYGYPADMDAIASIAQRRGLLLVEDCCLALGSRYDGRLTGTQGVAAYFSFQWNKTYTSGLGGMAVANRPELATRLSELQSESISPTTGEVMMLRLQLAMHRALIYPRTTALGQSVFRVLSKSGLAIGSSSREEYAPRMAEGFFKRMSDSQARSGISQLRKLDENLAHRRRMTRAYDELLQEHGWPSPQLSDRLDPALSRYPVRVADKKRLLGAAWRHLLELGSWFESPIHPIETSMEAYGYEAGMCPEAERASLEVINLPVHPRTNETTARRTVAMITRIGPAERPAATGK